MLDSFQRRGKYLIKYMCKFSFAAQLVKNLPASGGDTGDMGLIPGSGRSLKEEMETHSSILPWRIPWTEEPAGYSPWGHKNQT